MPERIKLSQLVKILEDSYGDPRWWPAETPFEVAVGAVLTQNTAWGNVEKAIQNLKGKNLLHPRSLATAPLPLIEELIRPSGYFRQKAVRLKRIAGFWLEEIGEDPRDLADPHLSTAELREKLLKISGIGPETADSILLYAFNRPIFVVDAYTARLVHRLGLLTPPFSYSELQEYFHERLPKDTALYNRLHAQIVLHGKTLCFKRNPLCHRCPLQPFCYGPSRDEEMG
jgi:endonuclease-3 related protein